MRSLRISAAVVMLAGCVSSSAFAEDDAFGGWDSDVGHQSFSGQRQPDATAGDGATAQGFGGYGLSPFADRSPNSSGLAGNFGFGTIQPPKSSGQTFGTNDQGNFSSTSRSGTLTAFTPLVHSIRHATKKRGRSR